MAQPRQGLLMEGGKGDARLPGPEQRRGGYVPKVQRVPTVNALQAALGRPARALLPSASRLSGHDELAALADGPRPRW
jgi:hypothetical protein